MMQGNLITKTYGGSYYGMQKDSFVPDDSAPPRYRLRAPYFGNEYGGKLYPEGEIIEFEGTPNPTMEPLNTPAKLAVEQWERALPIPGQRKFPKGKYRILGQMLEPKYEWRFVRNGKHRYALAVLDQARRLLRDLSRCYDHDIANIG